VIQIEELRRIIHAELDRRYDIGKVEAVGLNTIRIRLQSTGNILDNVPVIGGAQTVAAGDKVYLLRFRDGSMVGVSGRSSAAALTQASASIVATHAHDNLYYTETEITSQLALKADQTHQHDTTHLEAETGSIGGWEIDSDRIFQRNSELNSDGWIGFGEAPPDQYGNLAGVWLGWDPITDKAKLSLFSSVNSYLQWDGDKLLIKATNFTLDTNGNITATGGTIGGWTIASDRLVKDTGINATSAGLAPLDYPFYGGATYANRATAPFRVTPTGDLYATTGFFLGTLKVGAGNPAIDIDGANKRIRTSTFLAGLQGFNLDGVTGDAEFNNIKARGAFTVSTFTTNSIQATGGTSIVAKAVGVARADFTTVDDTYWNGLEGHWKLEETSGARVDVNAVNALDLTDNNTATSATGKQGTAASFDSGSSEYLSIVDNAPLSFGDVDFTIGCWVYLSSKASSRGLVSKCNGSGASATEYSLEYDSAGDRFQFRVSNGTTQTIVVANVFGSPAMSTWYYIFGQHYAGIDQIAIKVNGLADATAHTVGAQDSTKAFEIGRTNGSAYMNGRIDEVSVWRRALGDAEYTVLYNSGSGKAWPWDLSAVNVDVTDPDGITHATAGALWTVGDVVYIKDPATGAFWGLVVGKVDQTTYWRLGIAKRSPAIGTNYTFRKGVAIVNYGQSGAGVISQSADGAIGAAPNLSMVTHLGAPWAIQALRARLGNLNGSYDYVSDTYGIGLGEYGTGKTSLTVDVINGLRILNGAGTRIGQWRANGDILVGRDVSAPATTNLAIFNIAQTYNSESMSSGDVLIGDNTSAKPNLKITPLGLRLRTGTTVAIDLQADGDVFIGRDIATPSSTALVIFNNAQTYNGEASVFAAGDILIGDNSASKANLFWDQSLGRFNFRGGTTTQAYIDTSGYIIAGGDSIRIGNTGLEILVGNLAYEDAKALRFVDTLGGVTKTFLQTHSSSAGVATYAGQLLHGPMSSGRPVSSLQIQSAGETSANSGKGLLELLASYSGGATPVSLVLHCDSAGAGADVNYLTLTGAGLVVGTAPTTTVPEGVIDFREIAAPASPPANYVRLFADSTQSWPYFINDASRTVPLGQPRVGLIHSAAHLGVGVTLGSFSNNGFIQYLDNGLDSITDWNISLPRGWSGRTLTVKIWWSPSTTDTGQCNFVGEVRRLVSGTDLPGSATASVNLFVSGPGVVNRVGTNSGTMSLSSFSEGDAVGFRLFRDGNVAGDTFAGTAQVSAVELSVVG